MIGNTIKKNVMNVGQTKKNYFSKELIEQLKRKLESLKMKSKIMNNVLTEYGSIESRDRSFKFHF